MSPLLGLLVNPVAGMGGRVGLHGTDGPTRIAEARRLGAASVTAPRAARAISRLATRNIDLLTAPGAMGADVLSDSELQFSRIALDIGHETTRKDTEHAARMLADSGVELLLFAGGDGTANDVVRGAGTSLPILGIPSGVKMRSGVFARTPEAAGDLAADFLGRSNRPVTSAELLDLADEGTREALLGIATVPRLGGNRLVGSKNSSVMSSAAAVEATCREVARELLPHTLYLFGPGSTTGKILEELGIESTPLGVDAVLERKLVGADLNEDQILRLMPSAPRTKLVLGVIGGQGFVLGRGNQQIGPRVLDRLNPDDLIIVATAEKLLDLYPSELNVDIGDDRPYSWITGYHRVRIGPQRYMMMHVASPTESSSQ